MSERKKNPWLAIAAVICGFAAIPVAATIHVVLGMVLLAITVPLIYKAG